VVGLAREHDQLGVPVEQVEQQRRAGLTMADDEDRSLVEAWERAARDDFSPRTQPLGDVVDRREQVAPRRLDAPRMVTCPCLEERVDPPVFVREAHRQGPYWRPTIGW
jgi:hypothetical protein